MHHSGERRNPIVSMEKHSAERLIQKVLPDRKILSVDFLSSGLSNSNYKVTFLNDPNPVLLKIFSHERVKMEAEVNLFGFLKNRISVPEVIAFDSSQKMIPYEYAILKWINGEILSEVLKTGSGKDLVQTNQDLGQELGNILFKMSQIKFETMGFFSSDLKVKSKIKDFWDFFFPFIEDCLVKGRAGTRLGSDLTASVLELCLQNKDLIQGSPQNASLVHGDFNGKNILVLQIESKWKVSAVLDWEYSCSGPFLTDFGNLLRYDSQLSPEFEESLVRSFKSAGGVLPPHWKKIAKLLDLMNLCEFLNSEKEKPILWAHSKSLIVDTLTRFRTF